MTVAPLVIACGALASELRAVLKAQGLADLVEVTYLPANLHNRPERIVPELEPLLDEAVRWGKGHGAVLLNVICGPKDIAKITVRCSQATLEHAGWPYRPEGLTSAQLNLPYCVATWLLDGDCFVNQFTEAKVADPFTATKSAVKSWSTRSEVENDATAIRSTGASFCST